jgi:hypothetical protein
MRRLPTPFQKVAQRRMVSSRTSMSPSGIANAHSGPRTEYVRRCWRVRCSSNIGD